MSTTSRGLGWEHQQARAAALRALLPGTPCPFCCAPMFAEQRLDFDHVHPRVLGGHDGPRRLAHAACNRRAGRLLQARLQAAAAACPSCRAKVLGATAEAKPTDVPRPALSFFSTGIAPDNNTTKED